MDKIMRGVGPLQHFPDSIRSFTALESPIWIMQAFRPNQWSFSASCNILGPFKSPEEATTWSLDHLSQWPRQWLVEAIFCRWGFASVWMWALWPRGGHLKQEYTLHRTCSTLQSIFLSHNKGMRLESSIYRWKSFLTSLAFWLLSAQPKE